MPILQDIGNELREKKITARYIEDIPSTIMGDTAGKHAKAISDLGKNRPAQRRYVKEVLKKRLAQLEATNSDADKMSAEYVRNKLKRYTND